MICDDLVDVKADADTVVADDEIVIDDLVDIA